MIGDGQTADNGCGGSLHDGEGDGHGEEEGGRKGEERPRRSCQTSCETHGGEKYV